MVQAGQQLLQTEDASLGEVVGPERTENLPLNGRKFDDLAILTPGIAVYNPDLHSSSTDGSAISVQWWPRHLGPGQHRRHHHGEQPA